MSSQVFLAVDLGASSGRMIAGLLDNGSIKIEEIHRFPNGGVRVGQRLFWNWLGLWQHIKDALRIAGQRFRKHEIVSIGVDTWGVDFALLGADDSVLSSPICYRDSQTNGILEQAFKVAAREEIFAETGLQFLEFNSLFQLFAMKNRGDVALQNARHFLMIPDLIHWLLCGEKSNESTDASTTQLLNPHTKSWSTKLIDAFELPGEIFGNITPPGSHLGQLRKELAEEVGLQQINVVVPASHDTASAVAAVPIQAPISDHPDWCYISSGTWSCMGVELANAKINDLVRQFDYTNEGGVEDSTRLLKNIAGLWLVQECQRIWAGQGNELNWRELVSLAEQAQPLRSIIPPDHSGFLAPKNMPQAITDYCTKTNQATPESNGDVIRCALESIAMRYRAVLNQLEEIIGNKINTIHIVGGGSQNDLLNQFAADATGRDVVAGPVEATAIGNLSAQMIAAGNFNSMAEARKMIQQNFPTKSFAPQNVDAWDEAYEKTESICSTDNVR